MGALHIIMPYYSVMIFLLVITTVHLNKICCKRSQTILDCSNCNLTTLPQNLMSKTITELLLADNLISRIPSYSFIDMTSLKTLVLTNNPLQELDSNIFKGLKFLQNLEIGSTLQAVPAYLPKNVFNPLMHLRNLTLHYVYPIELTTGILGSLQLLEHLTIILGRNAILGDEFQKLKRLKSIHGWSKRRTGTQNATQTSLHVLQHVSKETFAAVPQLHELHLTGVWSMSHDSLMGFKDLQILCLPCNHHLNILDVFSAIRSQHRPMLQTLVLDYSGKHILSLELSLFNSTNFSKISHLAVRGTRITIFDQAVLYKLPNLKFFGFGANTLSQIKPKGHSPRNLDIWKLLNHMQIKAIDASYLYSHNKYSESTACSIKSKIDNFFPTPPEIVKPEKYVLRNRTVIPYGFSHDEFYRRNIPPSLQYIYIKHLAITRLHNSQDRHKFNTDNNILYLDLSYSKYFEGANIPLIEGLEKLQGFDISHTGITGMHTGQLGYLPSLKYLNVGHNNFKVNLVRFFAKANDLEWLDLSYNGLKSLPPFLLSNLTSIERISFQGNPLLTVMLDVHSNKRLQHIDLSNCALVNLPDSFLWQLDSLQSHLNHSLSLNMSSNRFQCSCRTISMIKWFSNTEVNILDKEHTACTFNNRTIPILDVDVESLAADCVPQMPSISLTSICVSVFLPMSVVIVGFLLSYQFRWYLKWHAYKIRHYLRQIGTPEDIPLDKIPYHAFVSYNHTDDYEWVADVLYTVVEQQWGFKLCIGQKDFIAGKPIAENIVDAIDKSHKTIIVVTPGFIQSEWCEFEMQMALTKGRHRLVIIYKEEVSVGDMSRTLRALMRNLNYIEYDQKAEELFWKRLKQNLSKPVKA